MDFVKIGAEETGDLNVLVHRVDGDREVVLYVMLFGNTRLCVGQAGAQAYDRGWCYRMHEWLSAVHDAVHWDGLSTDPPGHWYKSLQTQETRPEYE